MLSEAYQRWRSSELGRITDRLERALIFRLAGPVHGKSVLDVGCGDGALAVEFAKRGAVVTGVDLDSTMLALARTRAVEQGAQPRFVLAQAEQLPFPDARFDLVIASALLCLVPDRVRVVSEMARVLKPGGRLLIGELGRWSIWNLVRRIRGWFGAQPWRSAHFFKDGELRRLLAQAGVDTVAIEGSVYYPPVPWAAKLLAAADRWLGDRTTFGAAFLAASALKPVRQPGILDWDQTGGRHSVLGGSNEVTADPERPALRRRTQLQRSAPRACAAEE